MEIKPNDNLLATVYSKKTTKAGTTTDKTFGTVLEAFVSRSNKIDEGRKKPHLINNISTVHWNPVMSVEELSVVERAERLLDTLDEYQRKLANPAFTLREISPLVREIETENEHLGSATSSLPNGNELKKILDQVIITSSVEVIKFNRGDYVSP